MGSEYFILTPILPDPFSTLLSSLPMLADSIINQFTALLIGFSIFGCSLLLLAYAFFLRQMRKSAFTIGACAVLLGALALLQVSHFQFLLTGADLLGSRVYGLLLLLVPAAFLFFSTHVLMPDSRKTLPQLLHLLPLAAGLVLPVAWLAPIAFTVGTGYSLWFTRVIYRLRSDRARYRFEMFFFGLFALMAVLILLLGLLTPYIDDRFFYLGYANATGLALLLVIAGLIAFPELLTDLTDAARAAYTTSTLTGVDKQAALAKLDACMTRDRRFEDETLNLSSLAQTCELTSHQLSELINTSFGFGFSRYVRGLRVKEAQRLLIEDPRSSVLSIGMTTGFRSQSAFYAAFREETGQAPGQFRKQNLRSGTNNA